MIKRIMLLCALSTPLHAMLIQRIEHPDDLRHFAFAVLSVISLATTGHILISQYAESNATGCPVCVCPENLPQVTPCATELLHASQITDPQQLPHTAAVIEQLKEIAERFKNERKSSS